MCMCSHERMRMYVQVCMLTCMPVCGGQKSISGDILQKPFTYCFEAEFVTVTWDLPTLQDRQAASSREPPLPPPQCQDCKSEGQQNWLMT